jgi:1,4-dihydroxy-2-naphthoate octaprenyltransferase
MENQPRPNIVQVWFRELRAPFFTASIVPVLVGSAAGYSASGEFHAGLFALALFGVMCLHAGANIANDYFDHVSGNDEANRNLTTFSGGSRIIQQGLLSPRAVLAGSWTFLALGAVAAVVLTVLTHSLFILALGLVGLVGGYFYTATPVKLGYRGVGEIVIALLFGVLPVAGTFYLQAGCVPLWSLVPGALVGVLIALVLFANEFPDEDADRAANKRTLVVILGRERASRVYFVALGVAYVAAAVAGAMIHEMRLAGILFVATVPLAALALRFAFVELPVPGGGRHITNFLTIVLHVVAGVSLAAGFVIAGCMR